MLIDFIDISKLSGEKTLLGARAVEEAFHNELQSLEHGLGPSEGRITEDESKAQYKKGTNQCLMASVADKTSLAWKFLLKLDGEADCTNCRDIFTKKLRNQSCEGLNSHISIGGHVILEILYCCCSGVASHQCKHIIPELLTLVSN